MISFSLVGLFTRGVWVVKKGQNSVYVVIEWPLLKESIIPFSLYLGQELSLCCHSNLSNSRKEGMERKKKFFIQ